VFLVESNFSKFRNSAGNLALFASLELQHLLDKLLLEVQFKFIFVLLGANNSGNYIRPI